MVDSRNALDELTACLTIDKLLDLARRSSETYKHLAKTSTKHFLVTPVTALPTGKEQGKFLAIDVGGSNLRVGFIELVGEAAKPSPDSHRIQDDVSRTIKRSFDKSWSIEDHLKMDQPEDLFKWVGDCMAEVIREAINSNSILKDQEILLGVTFSFPMAQTRLSEATLLPMGKGFAITTNLNLGQMLLNGYARHCSAPHTEADPNSAGGPSSSSSGSLGNSHAVLPMIRVAAITNDTVATFISLAYAAKATPHSRVALGLIVGTGTNATVPMKLEDLHPEKQSQLQDHASTDNVVINTEWTICGTDKPLEDLGIKTKWDRMLDENSEAPGFQPFEYMTSGRYLGEIVRLAFVDATSTANDITDIPVKLQQKNAIPTRFLSEVVAHADEATLLSQLNKQYPTNEADDGSFWSPRRVRLLRDLARAVQQRSSALIAAACIGLLDCVGDIDLAKESIKTKNSECYEELVIAYTGGTISQYPQWLPDCQAWIDKLVAASASAPLKMVVLKEALDGGIIGAGVLASMGNRIA
ncbi:hexokinase-2 [Didymella exigua CBS 183.55]|uniref:Phosphotransferase n=1 Tax=Didymella exigua CBS 183.55 TaxID=1150837 RepID=A0A6A5RPC3_9PLEO|nr:hexokinase-2 [Didymella exigua CBS 183.55]KAF1928146.1 hexokinase-2 [Didymella exigua CBS 183.55]